MEINATALRMARAGLNWTAEDLAKISRVSVSAIRNFEAGKVSMMSANRERIERILQEAGVTFMECGHTGVALRVGLPPPSKPTKASEGES